MIWALYSFLIACTYYDIKERRIPDKLNLTGFIAGIIINLENNSLLESIVAGIIIGFTLFKIGFWAGGDFKFFVALAALMPEAKNALFAPLDSVVYGIVFTFVGIFIYSTYRAIKEKNIKAILFDVISYFKLVFPGVYVIVSFSKIHQILSLIGGAILFALSEKTRYLLFIGFLTLEMITMTDQVIPKIIKNGAMLIITFFVTLSIKYYFQNLNRKQVKINELKEGMIPAETYYEEDGMIKKFVINYEDIAKAIIKKKRIVIFPRNIIIDSRKARGLTTDEIEKLKELRVRKLISDEIPIKTSIPLIPYIFIGVLILQTIGGLHIII